MLWNQTKSKSPHHCSILYSDMQSQTGQAFFSRWVRACNEKGVSSRSIISDHFINSLKTWQSRHDTEKLQHWDSRYVAKEDFTINSDTVIYDDVACFYNWKNGKIFGMEIHNHEIATTQRQLFELLWKVGKATR